MEGLYKAAPSHGDVKIVNAVGGIVSLLLGLILLVTGVVGIPSDRYVFGGLAIFGILLMGGGTFVIDSGRRKCPHCSARGSVGFVRSEIVNLNGMNLTRSYYHCAKCGQSWSSDRQEGLQALSRPSTPVSPTVIQKETTIQSEIVKVPCKFCGTLNIIATDRFCAGCGAAVK